LLFMGAIILLWRLCDYQLGLKYCHERRICDRQQYRSRKDNCGN
jgi:hypothetical protein